MPSMRIGLIAPPFIEVPPRRYGGTELFVANLARELHARGHDVTVYANGESSLPCRVAWRYPASEWPPTDSMRMQLRNADHTSWAIREAAAQGRRVAPQRRGGRAVHEVRRRAHGDDRASSARTGAHRALREVSGHPLRRDREVARTPRADAARPRGAARHPARRLHVFGRQGGYVAFLGRMAPCKGAHLAMAAARRAGVRLKLAGEIQPIFHDYWNQQVRPGIDGMQIDLSSAKPTSRQERTAVKARALLFPIQWEEPFGLVMIEAMACGTPVLAFRGGAVEEIIRDGVNGWICADEADMAARLATLDISPDVCRAYVEEHFRREPHGRRIPRHLPPRHRPPRSRSCRVARAPPAPPPAPASRDAPRHRQSVETPSRLHRPAAAARGPSRCSRGCRRRRGACRRAGPRAARSRRAAPRSAARRATSRAASSRRCASGASSSTRRRRPIPRAPDTTPRRSPASSSAPPADCLHT